MQHEVTATCSTHSSWQKSFNFEIKLEKRRFTFFSKEIFLAQSQWEGEDGAILVGQVYSGLWEMVRTMFLQFFIWLTDGEGGRWGQRGRRKKEEDWGWKRREIEGTGAHPPCIMLNSKGLVTEWEGRRPRVHRCSARRGCMLTGRKNYNQQRRQAKESAYRTSSMFRPPPKCVYATLSTAEWGWEAREGSHLQRGNTVWPSQSPLGLHTYGNNWVVVKWGKGFNVTESPNEKSFSLKSSSSCVEAASSRVVTVSEQPVFKDKH